ncbi:SH3 domain-binding glutamic acid-rich-like protein [Armadillidium nasatum]|uniref:SH3 domain-binding glutamic acid-rich-like protein n=1 Tax=Armadillidium nasatum TaxID=96803 RepID=A0A5N5SRT1_9CRUS|nr:SH3 domain-binding glutamic acid-rich-like protein [Armadillidium nasatum]
MVIKVYVAMISCSQEVKKNQQRAVMILESKKIPYTIIDITDPANEDSKDYMVETGVPKEGFKIPVTPQIYNEADYCGDYDGLDMANECDTLGDFLKLSDEEKSAIRIGITGIAPSSTKKETKESPITNGVSASREVSEEKDLSAVTSSEIVEKRWKQRIPRMINWKKMRMKLRSQKMNKWFII